VEEIPENTVGGKKLGNRKEAIFRALDKADCGDVVIIAGKGHETYQIIGDTTIHFDDREEVFRYLNR
jgi:UDP-N-acetylmuramoyl-L-alanyl-D-glutamate--2,6-diaminopimelate ligase